jgi:type VI secretion system protein ImpH
MTTLLALLNDRLKIRLSGRQFVGAWYPLSETDRAVLGRRNGIQGQRMAGGRRLGEETTLGRRAWDQSAGIELETPALPIAQYLSLLPGGPAHVLLAWLASSHLQSEVEIRLCITMQMPTGDRPAAQAALQAVMGLGCAQGPRLGLTSWLLGAPRPPGDSKVAFAPARFKVRMDPFVERETE